MGRCKPRANENDPGPSATAKGISSRFSVG